MSTETFEQAGWATDTFKAPQGKLVVTFHEVQKKDTFKSTQENRPVFKSVVHIRKYPADQYLLIDRPVSEADKEEFPVEWERWEKTKETKVAGLPIDNWHSISDTQKAEFKAIRIFTVEQFADLPDSYAMKIMNFQELREKAKVFVASGKDAELVASIRREANAEVEAMKKRMLEMESKFAEMMGTKKAKA